MMSSQPVTTGSAYPVLDQAKARADVQDRQESAAVSATGTENGLMAGLEECLARGRSLWPADQSPAQVLTRAPGRLDCMGGMADYSGALVLQMPIDRGAYVLAGQRDDQKVAVISEGWGPQGHAARCEWPLSWLYQSDGQIVSPEVFRVRFEDCGWVRHVAGVCLSLLESGCVPHLAGGVTLVVLSDIPVSAGLASSAAIQVASAKALAALFGAELTDYQLLAACRSANTEVVGAEPGLVDHATCLWGESGALLQVVCQPDNVLGTVSLPPEVRFAAVDSGVRLPIYAERYADNRAAAVLGRFLIERLLGRSEAMGDPAGGYLANITPSEYVRRFRNELPVKIKGRDFLAEFGQPENLKLSIDPDRVYKVRSRTEHHIYENDRTHRFMERLGRVRRTGERDALIEAGELMYASHWSYGQRCGMGSIETDVLVNMIRERGPARGLYGAKVTGGGCGGSVAVLMADHGTALSALEEACSAYSAKTGKQATLLRGSSPGAAGFGVRPLD